MIVRRIATLLLALCAMTTLVHADTISQLVLGPNGCSATGASCNGYQFTTTVTQTGANAYDVAFNVANISGPQSYLQGFSLTLFSGAIDASFLSTDPALASGWTVNVVDNSKINNGNDNCGKGSNAGATCFTIDSSTGLGYLLKPEQSITFYLRVTGTAPSVTMLNSWHIMGNGTKCGSGSGPNCGNVFALSNDGDPIPVVPEPASMLLFGAGFATLAAFRRRRN